MIAPEAVETAFEAHRQANHFNGDERLWKLTRFTASAMRIAGFIYASQLSPDELQKHADNADIFLRHKREG